jgi:hypothetical protein
MRYMQMWQRGRSGCLWIVALAVLALATAVFA